MLQFSDSIDLYNQNVKINFSYIISLILLTSSMHAIAQAPVPAKRTYTQDRIQE
jgi:hypothetical protein